jgi:hypothetical protein
MRPVETIPWIGVKENDRQGSTMINSKKFCKCYKVPLV